MYLTDRRNTSILKFSPSKRMPLYKSFIQKTICNAPYSHSDLVSTKWITPIKSIKLLLSLWKHKIKEMLPGQGLHKDQVSNRLKSGFCTT